MRSNERASPFPAVHAQQIDSCVNGVLYDRGEESLRAAIYTLKDREWDADRIMNTAEQYDVDLIASKWQRLLQEGT